MLKKAAGKPGLPRGSSTLGPERVVRVWDPLVRCFHWSAAGLTLLCLVTENETLAVHVGAGYTLLGLMALRIVWGFVGPRHARFVDFCYRPSTVLRYFAGLLRGTAPRYMGHSPAGGAMIVALMAAVTLAGLSGLAALGAEEHSGPLAGVLSGANLALRNTLGMIHGSLGGILWFLIGGHLAGVALASLAHHENLVAYMVHGKKRAADHAPS